MLGRLPAADVRDELSGAAMVLMPSRYHEFSPYSALEAMAAGVRRLLSADLAVAVTGSGGPSAQDGQEPGTVHAIVDWILHRKLPPADTVVSR